MSLLRSCTRPCLAVMLWMHLSGDIGCMHAGVLRRPLSFSCLSMSGAGLQMMSACKLCSTSSNHELSLCAWQTPWRVTHHSWVCLVNQKNPDMHDQEQHMQLNLLPSVLRIINRPCRSDHGVRQMCAPVQLALAPAQDCLLAAAPAACLVLFMNIASFSAVTRRIACASGSRGPVPSGRLTGLALLLAGVHLEITCE